MSGFHPGGTFTLTRPPHPRSRQRSSPKESRPVASRQDLPDVLLAKGILDRHRRPRWARWVVCRTLGNAGTTTPGQPKPTAVHSPQYGGQWNPRDRSAVTSLTFVKTGRLLHRTACLTRLGPALVQLVGSLANNWRESSPREMRVMLVAHGSDAATSSPHTHCSSVAPLVLLHRVSHALGYAASNCELASLSHLASGSRPRVRFCVAPSLSFQPAKNLSGGRQA